MSKNILVLSNSIGGLYNFRKEVIKAIVDAGYRLFISVPEEGEVSDYFKGTGCVVIITPFNRRGINPIADFKQMLSYRKLMKQLTPAAVLTYTIKPNVYGGIASRLCHVPQLANVTGLGDAVENGGWLQKLTTGLYKFGLGKAHRIFFQNSGNRKYCIKLGIADENSVLLPGSGVNLQHHVYQEYPAEDGKIRFLFIGRLLKDTGTEEFFETAKVIKNKYTQTEFQVVGSVDGNYQAQLDDLVHTGVINYLGSQSDVRPFIGKAHCTIMPSYHEGMSNVNLESAANGRPVITTNVPGCRETVDDGRTGYLVEVKSAKSLTECVERFIALPYSQKAKMGKNGREKVEKEFNRQIVVDAYLKEIESLAHV
jgi:galacturonosyltransferase